MPSFSLADLIPEPTNYIDDTFGGDGSRYPMRSTQEFSAEDFAIYLRLQREAAASYASLTNRKQDAEKAQRGAQQLIQVLDELLLLLMPTMPKERLSAVPSWAKQKILERWREDQPKSEVAPGQGEAPGDRPKMPRGKRSPASAASTGAAP